MKTIQNPEIEVRTLHRTPILVATFVIALFFLVITVAYPYDDEYTRYNYNYDPATFSVGLTYDTTPLPSQVGLESGVNPYASGITSGLSYETNSVTAPFNSGMGLTDTTTFTQADNFQNQNTFSNIGVSYDLTPSYETTGGINNSPASFDAPVTIDTNSIVNTQENYATFPEATPVRQTIEWKDVFRGVADGLKASGYPILGEALSAVNEASLTNEEAAAKQARGEEISYWERPWFSSELGLSALNLGANYGTTVTGYLTNDLLHSSADVARIKELNAGMNGFTPEQRQEYIQNHADDYANAGAISIFDGGDEHFVVSDTTLTPRTVIDYYDQGNYDDPRAHYRGTIAGLNQIINTPPPVIINNPGAGNVGTQPGVSPGINQGTDVYTPNPGGQYIDTGGQDMSGVYTTPGITQITQPNPGIDSRIEAIRNLLKGPSIFDIRFEDGNTMRVPNGMDVSKFEIEPGMTNIGLDPMRYVSAESGEELGRVDFSLSYDPEKGYTVTGWRSTGGDPTITKSDKIPETIRWKDTYGEHVLGSYTNADGTVHFKYGESQGGTNDTFNVYDINPSTLAITPGRFSFKDESGTEYNQDTLFGRPVNVLPAPEALPLAHNAASLNQEPQATTEPSLLPEIYIPPSIEVPLNMIDRNCIVNRWDKVTAPLPTQESISQPGEIKFNDSSMTNVNRWDRVSTTLK